MCSHSNSVASTKSACQLDLVQLAGETVTDLVVVLSQVTGTCVLVPEAFIGYRILTLLHFL